MEKVYSWVLKITESRLTKRKAKKQTQKNKKKTFLSETLSWLDALLFAVVVIFLLNQFFLQMFVIPSPSMDGTLYVGDRVEVNKQAYGVELYPQGPKIFETRIPDRDEIITFYNPQYESRGPLFDILSQFVYMGTLGFVNIDKDENGNPGEKLFVKRTVGEYGDVIRFVDGKVLIKASGTEEWLTEEEFRAQNGLSELPHTSIDASLYPAINAFGRLMSYQNHNLNSLSPSYLLNEYRKIASDGSYYDYYQFSAAYAKQEAQFTPGSLAARSESKVYDYGIYVPEDFVLPLGDNRDNSTDGRYFGPVPVSDINGKVIFTLWPVKHADNFI